MNPGVWRKLWIRIVLIIAGFGVLAMIGAMSNSDSDVPMTTTPARTYQPQSTNTVPPTTTPTPVPSVEPAGPPADVDPPDGVDLNNDDDRHRRPHLPSPCGRFNPFC